MSENKTPEDDSPDSFNEDFDFGEGESSHTPPTRVSGKQGPNRRGLMIVFVVVVLGIVVLGYKFYGGSSKISALFKPSSTTKAPTQITKKESIEQTAKGTVPSTTPNAQTSESKTTETSATQESFGDIAEAFSSSKPAGITPNTSASAVPAAPTPTPAATPTPTAATTPTPIASGTTAAFSPTSPASPTAPASVASNPSTTPPVSHETIKKSTTIQEIQKDLFAPEHPNAPLSTAKEEKATPVRTETASTPPTTPGEEAEIAQLTESLSKLNQQIDYISNRIKHLDSYSRDVSDNLNKLNETIHSMDNRLSTLTTTTSTLSRDVGSVKNQVGHVQEVLKEDGLELSPAAIAPHRRKASAGDGKIVIEEPEYYVHAVIPGRAWLKSAKGQIITVTEGDTVGNYGKILVIDAANGVVLTSSGVTFR